MPAGYFAPALGMLWKTLAHYQYEPANFFAEAGLSREQIADPNMRIPDSVIHQLWERAHQQIDDPSLGLRAAEYFHPSHLGSLGYAWLASNSLRSALQCLSRYIRLLTEEREVLVTERGGNIRIEICMETGVQSLAIRTDVSMTVLMTMCRWNYGATLKAVEVVLKRDKNASHIEFESFLGCSPEYGADANILVLSTEDVDAPFVSANPVLAQISDHYLQEYLKRLDQDDLIVQVKKIIADNMLGNTLPIETLAMKLNMSVRTLQRRLKELQSTYKQLIDETRFELAKSLLRDECRTLTDVAFSTGFSSQSSFTHAVKRWTGLPPTDYRLQLLLKE